MNSEKIIINKTKEVMVKYPNKVLEYGQGKTALLGLFVGDVMKNTHNMFDPNFVNKIVKEELDKEIEKNIFWNSVMQHPTL